MFAPGPGRIDQLAVIYDDVYVYVYNDGLNREERGVESSSSSAWIATDFSDAVATAATASTAATPATTAVVYICCKESIPDSMLLNDWLLAGSISRNWAITERWPWSFSLAVRRQRHGPARQFA